MNKIYLSLILLLLTLEVSAQRSTPKKEFTQEDYLRQSKNANTAGWLLLIGGAVAILIPIGTEAFNEPTDQLGLVLSGLTIGTVAVGAGIPLLLSAGSAKRKAARLSIQTQSFPKLQNQNIVSSSAPSVALKITF